MVGSRRTFFKVSGLVAAGMLVHGTAKADPWDEVDAILARIKPPAFPDKDFDVTAYGGKADGKTDNTAAFKKAVEAANAAGGGRVVAKGGTFLTGGITLLSNVNLFVDKGAKLLFSTDPKKYLPVVETRWQGIECLNHQAFVYANKATNIAITGGGTLDGQGQTWKPWGSGGSDWSQLQKWGADGTPVAQRKLGEGHKLRPNLIQFVSCENILISGITIERPPMWSVHPVKSRNITVEGVTINSRGGGGNNDGVDPECCTDVHIKNSTFNTGDDCIAIKSGRDVDGRRVNMPSQNIVIENNKFVFSNRGAICIGSEASGGARNIYARNCAVNQANTADQLWYAVFIKTSKYRGGVIENIHFRDITANKLTKSPVFITLNYSGSGNSGPVVNPVVRNITFERLIVAGSKEYAVEIDGLSASKVSNVIVSNSKFTAISKGANKLTNSQNITFPGTTVNGKPA
ncbi:glycoside hydrolase family 28 protein [Lentzea sp. NPDC006480]|uniref:glycoside hydrolase family 28 protein n=1 Tax=Lentzea sp. NPDC006480 TaxID=3157176 RepID=UPI0033B3C4AC